MRNVVKGTAIAITSAVITAALVLTALPTEGQTQAAGTARRVGGRPNLNGIWQALNEANYDIQAHVARPAMALRDGPHGPVPAREVLYLGAVGSVPPGVGIVDGDEIPYTPAALEQKRKNQANWLNLDPEIKCYLPGVPRATYMPQPFQIFHSEQAVFIAYQFAGATRNIYLKDPGPAPVDSWMGQSVGRWDGDTFVVEVTGFNDQTWFDRAGNFHSAAMKVTERYTPQGPDVLWYEATIEDSETFTRPWKMSMPLYRRLEKNAQLMEFKCVEFVEELMYGEWRKNPLPR
jgi:hypothetical protein